MLLKSKYIFISIILLFSSIDVFGQWDTLVNERFANRDKLIDNSLLLYWGTYQTPHSAYETGEITDVDGLAYVAIYLTDSAMKYSDYHDTSLNSTKASTCLDWYFGTFNRNNNDTLKIEFDILWSEMDGSGERGRVNCILLHEYPEGGADFNDVDSLDKYHPFGRPAYHFRARNSKMVVNKGFIGVGGGNDSLGRLYIHDEWAGPDSLHWLPGAVPPTTEGSSPYTFPEEINQKNYTTTIASASSWQHITWTIEPERFLLHGRDSKDSASGKGTLIAEVAIPKNNPGNYYSLYHWYKNLEAFRIYYNGLGHNTYLANLKILSSGGATTVNNTENIASDDFLLYPNPVNGYISIICPKEEIFLEIFNVNGVKVFSTRRYTNKKCFDVKALSDGIYFARVTTDKDTQILKFVKRNL